MNQMNNSWSGSCEGQEEALNLYVDGELPLEQQAELFNHLARCESCRRTLDSVMRFRRYGRQEYIAIAPAVDDAFLKRLAGAKRRPRRVSVDRDPMWSSRVPVSLRSAVAIAAAVFLVGLLIPLWGASPHRLPIVSGQQEQVDLSSEVALGSEAVYVFYPGLTVEAAKPSEGVQPERL